MLTKFWEGIGEKLAEKWIATMIAPAFIFWAGGVIAWSWHFSWTALETWFTHLSLLAQGTVLFGSLLVVLASSVVVQGLEFSILRLLEGYWPRWIKGIQRQAIRRQKLRLGQANQRWQNLSRKGLSNLTDEERDEYVTLDQRTHKMPEDEKWVMPTALGNILRAAETRPITKYGLDPVICWPRLWLVLPDSAKQEITTARSSLDTSVRIWFWSVLFIIWTYWAWWALPIGILTSWWSYQRALNTAEIYGDLLEAAFDLHRMALYEAMRWPLPMTTADEDTYGGQLTIYLFRGTLEKDLEFNHPQR